MDRFKTFPDRTQEGVLRALLRRARRTEWGRHYDFSNLLRESDLGASYRTTVPIHDYEDYRADVERVRRGTSNVFWPGRFRHFAVSSGTVSTGNIIPVSMEMLRFNRAFSYAVTQAYFQSTGDYRALYGKLLSVPGRVEPHDGLKNAYIGEVSGLVALISPAVFKWTVEALPRRVYNISDWEEKLDAIVEISMDMDVRSIVMVPTWAIILFKKLIARYNRTHARSVTTVLEIWPNLRVFFSGGVALSAYRNLLVDQVGAPITFVESYGASEGFFSFQDGANDKDMLLHLDNGVFYEFVEMNDPSEPPGRLPLADVQTGVPYQMFVSTCSGLWAYGVGDVIEFTSLLPYRIIVTGRTNEILDTYGEAVYGNEAAEALEVACRRLGVSVHGFHIAPVELTAEQIPRHQWFVEFDGLPPSLAEFSAEIDRHLRSVNRHYTIRREAGAFLAPEIVAMPDRSFYDWLKATRSTVSVQSKIPRMSRDREIADQLLSLLGNKTFSPSNAGSK